MRISKGLLYVKCLSKSLNRLRSKNSERGDTKVIGVIIEVVAKESSKVITVDCMVTVQRKRGSWVRNMLLANHIQHRE